MNNFQQFKQQRAQNSIQQNPSDPQRTGFLPYLPTLDPAFPETGGDNPIVAAAKYTMNLPGAATNAVFGLGNLLGHPVESAKNLGGLALGGIEAATGQQGAPDASRKLFDSAVQQYKTKYFTSPEEAEKALVNDPAGFIMDALAVVGGVEGLAKVGASGVDAVTGSKAAIASENAADFSQTGLNVMPQVGAARGAVDAALGKVGGAVETIGAPIADPITNFAKQVYQTALSPFGKSVDVGLEGAAERLGINATELPAGARTNSSVARMVEAAGANSIGGQAIVNRAESAGVKLAQAADRIINEAGGAQDLVSAGEIIGKGLTSFVKDFKDTVSGLYDKFLNVVGDKIALRKNTIDALNEILASKKSIGDAEGLSFFKGKMQALQNKKAPPTFNTLKEMRTDVEKRIGNHRLDAFASANVQQLRQLSRALKDDIYATMKAQRGAKAQQIAADYETANQVYSKGRQAIETGIVRSIAKFVQAKQWDKILPKLLSKSTSITDIQAVMNMTGEAGSAEIRTSLLKDLFDRSLGSSNEAMPNLNPGVIEKEINRNGDRLRAILTPEQFQGLEDVGRVAKGLSKLGKITQGSQTAYIFRQFATLGVVGSAAIDLITGNVASAATKLGGVFSLYAGSRIIGSSFGQRLLTYGFANYAETQAALAAMKAEGLTKPSEGGNMNTYGNTQDTNNGGGNGGAGGNPNPLPASPGGNPGSTPDASGGG